MRPVVATNTGRRLALDWPPELESLLAKGDSRGDHGVGEGSGLGLPLGESKGAGSASDEEDKESSC